MYALLSKLIKFQTSALRILCVLLFLMLSDGSKQLFGAIPKKFELSEGQYAVHVRSYIPWDEVAKFPLQPPYRGDGRAPSVSNDVTSRTNLIIVIDLAEGKVVNTVAWADPSRQGKDVAVASPIATSTTFFSEANRVDLSFFVSASDPLVPYARDLGLHRSVRETLEKMVPPTDALGAVSLEVRDGIMAIETRLWGDLFPSAEIFIEDSQGTGVMIASHDIRGRMPNTLKDVLVNIVPDPLMAMPDGRILLAKGELSISLTPDGNFRTVQQGVSYDSTGKAIAMVHTIQFSMSGFTGSEWPIDTWNDMFAPPARPGDPTYGAYVRWHDDSERTQTILDAIQKGDKPLQGYLFQHGNQPTVFAPMENKSFSEEKWSLVLQQHENRKGHLDLFNNLNKTFQKSPLEQNIMPHDTYKSLQDAANRLSEHDEVVRKSQMRLMETHRTVQSPLLIHDPLIQRTEREWHSKVTNSINPLGENGFGGKGIAQSKLPYSVQIPDPLNLRNHDRGNPFSQFPFAQGRINSGGDMRFGFQDSGPGGPFGGRGKSGINNDSSPFGNPARAGGFGKFNDIVGSKTFERSDLFQGNPKTGYVFQHGNQPARFVPLETGPKGYTFQHGNQPATFVPFENGKFKR